MTIKLHKVSKRYNKQWIFKDVDYTFENGKQYAITGTNGSGKSTLLQMIFSTISPTEGNIEYLDASGNSVSQNDLFSLVSFTSPYLELIEEFTLQEVVDFHFKFRECIDGFSKKQIIDILGFKPNKQIENFSSGMKQRLKLLLAISTKSSILLLDEPTANFDEQGIEWYYSLVEEYAQDRTVIVASAQPYDFKFTQNVLKVEVFKKKTDTI